MPSNLEQRVGKDSAGAEKGQPVGISLNEGQKISGLAQAASHPRAGYILAHGAGAGMTHPFLAGMAQGLQERAISVLRYQFPYMEARAKRPDTPAVAQAVVRAAVAQAAHLFPGVGLFAGGKSFGGRMTSQAQAAAPMEGARGLIFLGFPLHPPGQPSAERAKHLFDVKLPMLFLQGSRDEFAHGEFLQPLIEGLGARATLKLFPEADHSFHVPKRSGRNDAEIKVEMVEAMVAWMDKVLKE